MDEYLIYHFSSADNIAEDIANSFDPSDPITQRRICRKYGVELDDLTDDEIDYLSDRVNHYMRGY